MRSAMRSKPIATCSSCFNGTAANSLALTAICRNTDAIVCHAMAHINVDECGAPEFFSGGAKLLTADTPHAKLTSDAVTALAVTPHDEHSSRPRALCTDAGDRTRHAVLRARELERLCALAHALGMKVQLDGARFANAVASLGCTPADIVVARRRGRAVPAAAPRMACRSARRSLFFDSALAEEFGAPAKAGRAARVENALPCGALVGVLEDGAWLRHAAHANAMAQQLAAAIAAASRDAIAGACRGQRRVRRLAGSRHRRGAREGLAVLQLRRCNGRALHVLVGHHTCDRRRASPPICVTRYCPEATIANSAYGLPHPDQTLEVLNARSKGRLPELVGYRVTALEEGMVAAELDDIRPGPGRPQWLPACGHGDRACGHGVRLRLPRAPACGRRTLHDHRTQGQLPGHGDGRHDRMRCDAGASRQHHAGLGRGGDAQGGRQETRVVPLHATRHLAEEGVTPATARLPHPNGASPRTSRNL